MARTVLSFIDATDTYVASTEASILSDTCQEGAGAARVILSLHLNANATEKADRRLPNTWAMMTIRCSVFAMPGDSSLSMRCSPRCRNVARRTALCIFEGSQSPATFLIRHQPPSRTDKIADIIAQKTLRLARKVDVAQISIAAVRNSTRAVARAIFATVRSCQPTPCSHVKRHHLPVEVTPRILTRARTHDLLRQAIRQFSRALTRLRAKVQSFTRPAGFVGHVHASEASRTWTRRGVMDVRAAEAVGFVFEADGREVGVAGVVDEDGGAGAIGFACLEVSWAGWRKEGCDRYL